MKTGTREDRLTDEGRRILQAAADRRLGMNRHGRYVIDGDDVRPDRKERERLFRWGYLHWHYGEGIEIHISATGRGALAHALTKEHPRGHLDDSMGSDHA